MKSAKRNACQTCRVRHLPCDGEQPRCGQCRNQKRRCTPRFNVRFSHRRAWSPSSSKKRRTSGTSNLSTPQPTVQENCPPGSEELESIPDLSPPSEANLDHVYETDQSTVTLSPGQYSHSSLSLVAPELTRHETILFQYFAASAGPWLDLADPDFTVEVLHLAPTCPVLRWSVLALSSFHFSRLKAGGGEEAEVFHDKAVTTLLSLLPDRTLLTDGAVLASTVILRLYEESKALQDGQDSESHLLGGHIFATMAHEEQGTGIKLARAAWWIHQRQDVYRAIFHQNPTRTEVNLHRLSEISDLTDVYAWVRRAQTLAGQVADFCFGPNGQPIAAFDELEHKLQEWSAQCPPSFIPLYYAERDLAAGRFFPEIRFALNSGLTGYVHHNLSRLLMTMYNPKSPKMGLQAIHWHKQLELDIQTYVRTLCGTAYYNACPVGRIIACLAIRLCITLIA